MLPCPSQIPLPLFQMNEVCFANRAIGNLCFCWASCVPDEDKSKRTEVGLWGYRILHESNFYSEQVASTRVSYTHTNFSRLVYLVQTPSAAVFSCLSLGLSVWKPPPAPCCVQQSPFVCSGFPDPKWEKLFPFLVQGKERPLLLALQAKPAYL